MYYYYCNKFRPNSLLTLVFTTPQFSQQYMHVYQKQHHNQGTGNSNVKEKYKKISKKD